MDDDRNSVPESLIPYEAWTEDALRHVVARALRHAGEHGLQGGHHFYLTFRTDFPGVSIPARLRAQYPEEMTIVLQHQFWDLVVDEENTLMSVGLSFGGVPATLRIPLAAMSAFADPHVRYGLRFNVAEPAADEPPPEPPAPEPPPEPPPPPPAPSEPSQVVSLDAFRRRPTPKT